MAGEEIAYCAATVAQKQFFFLNIISRAGSIEKKIVGHIIMWLYDVESLEREHNKCARHFQGTARNVMLKYDE